MIRLLKYNNTHYNLQQKNSISKYIPKQQHIGHLRVEKDFYPLAKLSGVCINMKASINKLPGFIVNEYRTEPL